MYAIIVYDVGVERVNKVRIFLRQYLNWVQNSVFEGELTEAEMARVKARLKKLIEPEHDSVLFYTVKDKRWMGFDSMGTKRAETSNIL